MWLGACRRNGKSKILLEQTLAGGSIRRESYAVLTKKNIVGRSITIPNVQWEKTITHFCGAITCGGCGVVRGFH